MNAIHYIAGLIIICVLYVGVYAGLNKFSQDRIIHSLSASFATQDKEAVQERINFEKVRFHSKVDLKDKINDLSVIDHYVQPDFIEPLFMLKDHYFEDYESKDFVRETAFDGPFRFSVMLGYPKKEGSDRIVTFNEQMSQVKVYFHLEGWTWKIFKVDVPDFLVPRTKLTPEQVKARAGNA